VQASCTGKKMEFGITSVAGITVICYLVGEIGKASPLESRWVPILCGLCGGFLGILGLSLMPGFPAEDYLTAVAVGIVSGLAATGVNQAVQKLSSSRGKGA
jgi:hypothetical protein